MTDMEIDSPPTGRPDAGAISTRPMPRRKSISIVSACRNEKSHIRAFIDSLLAQELAGFDWEIIIADGASTDGTREMLSDLASTNPNIVVIGNPALIASTGLNAAIIAARGEIILRMDAHTEYARDYIQRCVQTLETTGAENVGGPARTKAEGLHARAIQAAYHSRFSTGGARFHDDQYSGYVDTVTYGCWRKETLLKLGLFDEQLVRNQDDELNLRLIRSGGKIWQSSEIVSWYRPRATPSALFRQYFQYGFWKVRVIRKHKIPGSWRHLIPGTFVVVNLMLMLTALYAELAGHWELRNKLMIGWGILFAVYCAACVIASVAAARKCGWKLLPFLPVTFSIFHISYGLGFLIGVVYWSFARYSHSRLAELFVGVTR
jgi:succinoglycan biosynthesis protein ExoA